MSDLLSNAEDVLNRFVPDLRNASNLLATIELAGAVRSDEDRLSYFEYPDLDLLLETLNSGESSGVYFTMPVGDIKVSCKDPFYLPEALGNLQRWRYSFNNGASHDIWIRGQGVATVTADTESMFAELAYENPSLWCDNKKVKRGTVPEIAREIGNFCFVADIHSTPRVSLLVNAEHAHYTLYTPID